MFAYCNNNPIMGCDPCGTCIHNWKFYDCEKCAAFWSGVGEWFVDTYDTITSVHQQQAQLQTQITMQQNEMIADAAGTVWDAYVHSNELQVQQKYQQDMTVRGAITGELESWSNDPARAGDFAANLGSATTGYIGYAALASGASIPVVGQWIVVGVGAVCVTWSVLRYYSVV